MTNSETEQTTIDSTGINLSALPQIGEVINEKYIIVREIARGGMGVVYEAKNITFDTKVAIKMLYAQEASPAIIKRFEREFQVCNQLSHPNIIKMYDCGMYKKNPYIVMDYIEGIPITKYIAQHDPNYGTEKKRDYKLCVKLIAQIAHALEYVHQYNIYHRDIKPSNILVCEDGKPILIDFGIAKFQQNYAQSLTKTNEIVGTCNYMSPEQVEGKHAKLDQRSDLYSLGTVLYELLTENKAFTGNIMNILNQIATTYPPIPSSVRKDIPKALDNIVMTAIEKDRKYRFQDAKDFANALEEYLVNENKGNVKKYRKMSHVKQIHKKNNRYLLIGTISIIILASITIFMLFSGKENIAQTKKDIVQNKKLDDSKDDVNSKTVEDKKITEQLKIANTYMKQQKYKEAFQIFQELAEQGNEKAQFQLAQMFQNGQGTEKNISKAKLLYEQLANKGNIEAQCCLGFIYLNYQCQFGKEEPKDIGKAIYWFEKAANKGHAKSQFHLGVIFFNDYSPEFPQSFQKAFYWFSKAANKGQHQAQYHLGILYLKGQGVKQDIEKAIYWFEKSAKQKNPEAQNILKKIFLNSHQ